MRSVNASVNFFALALAVAVSGQAFAQQSKGAPAAKPSAPKDEKVDISDLENKYWAPKDTDFSVVQNRTYTKEKRIFLSLQYGIPVSDSYSTGATYALTGNYFFTERHGAQFTYMKADMHPNSAVSDLQNYGGTGVYPDHGRISSYWSLGYNFVPFYSKMSFMGTKIIYFDMAVTPTLGMTNYEQVKLHGNGKESAFTYGLDITQYFFFTNWIAMRVDWKNQWYSQKVVKFKDTNIPTFMSEGSGASTKFIHDSFILLGVTFFY